MIVEYLRPETLELALDLIARVEPKSYPMGGGTFLNRSREERYAVVDLQALGLDGVEREGNKLRLGAMTTLQKLVEMVEIPETLREAAKKESTYNLRQVASLAGTAVTADGRSRLTGCLLAMEVTLELEGKAAGKEQTGLGELLALRDELLRGKLITAINLPLHVRLACESVSRTAGDEPIVFAAVAQWPSGRTRLVLGGTGRAPMMAMDGPEVGGVEIAARSAYSRAGDAWASAEYRQEMAGVLAKRAIEQVSN